MKERRSIQNVVKMGFSIGRKYGDVHRVCTRNVTSLRRRFSCNTDVTNVEVQDTDFLDTPIWSKEVNLICGGKRTYGHTHLDTPIWTHPFGHTHLDTICQRWTHPFGHTHMVKGGQRRYVNCIRILCERTNISKRSLNMLSRSDVQRR